MRIERRLRRRAGCTVGGAGRLDRRGAGARRRRAPGDRARPADVYQRLFDGGLHRSRRAVGHAHRRHAAAASPGPRRQSRSGCGSSTSAARGSSTWARSRPRASALALGGAGSRRPIAAMVVAGGVAGAPGRCSRLLRAFANTNEIITSLMLNYVAGLFLNYLIFDSSRTGATPRRRAPSSSPQGKALPDAATWPTFGLGTSLVIPLGLLLGGRARGRRLGALQAHALRLRGCRDRRLAAGRALRGHAHAAQDPRRDGAVR